MTLECNGSSRPHSRCKRSAAVKQIKFFSWRGHRLLCSDVGNRSGRIRRTIPVLDVDDIPVPAPRLSGVTMIVCLPAVLPVALARYNGLLEYTEYSNPRSAPPRAGDSFIVYRIGQRPSLDGKNGGNAASVANHIIWHEDFESPSQVGADKSNKVFAFRVELNADPGEYQQGPNVKGDSVGRSVNNNRIA